MDDGLSVGGENGLGRGGDWEFGEGGRGGLRVGYLIGTVDSDKNLFKLKTRTLNHLRVYISETKIRKQCESVTYL